MQTLQNSLNIDWTEYQFDGYCPGCDQCRDCGHKHLVHKGHMFCSKSKPVSVEVKAHPFPRYSSLVLDNSGVGNDLTPELFKKMIESVKQQIYRYEYAQLYPYPKLLVC